MIDLFGEAPNNLAVDMLNRQVIQRTQGKATLFLFTPRNRPDQWRRPYLYQFGGEMKMAVDETINRALRGTANGMTTMMLNQPIARSAILPNAQGQLVTVSNLNDYWTFILIIDNDNGVNPLGMATSTPTRMLYSGWIMGEPVTKRNMTVDSWAHNPSAQLITTHHTTLCVHECIGPTQTYSQINTTGDFDYYDGNMMQQLTPTQEQLYDLQPSKIANNICDVEPNMFTVAPAPIKSNRTTTEISTDINRPTHHLQKVIGGLIDSVKLSDQANQMGSVDALSGGDVMMRSFELTLGGGTSNVVLNGLRPNQPFSMQDLDDRYGTSLMVQVCETPKDATYELSDGQRPSARNVFTSVISSSLPSMLAQYGLADCAFRYNSAMRPNELFPDPNKQGVMEVYNFSSLYGATDQALRLAWENFERELRMCLFPIIRSNAGEFDLTAWCSIAGCSLVNLNLLDDMTVESGMQENSNLLGGMNTPFLGINGEFQRNAGELYHLTQDVANINVNTALNQPLIF